ncbi:MAG: ABC transporter ATP-binding protein, partial [Amylibacter sp.]|nr:ABC transporter ATP-binding protein [Amylibacter sp.]
MAKISIHNLTKRYGNMTELKNVSLEIDNGEFLVLLGPSGCGKTTLLRCLAGLETPDEGEIIIGNEVIFSSEQKIMQPPGKRNLGMVFQSYALWPHMTVRENVKFGLDVLKTPKETSDRQLDEVLKKLSMDSLSERYPSELSGGQQQRVALARLLATKPPVFLMDEPLSNLDARLRMDMRVELKRFQSDAGATTVYVT